MKTLKDVQIIPEWKVLKFVDLIKHNHHRKIIQEGFRDGQILKFFTKEYRDMFVQINSSSTDTIITNNCNLMKMIFALLKYGSNPMRMMIFDILFAKNNPDSIWQKEFSKPLIPLTIDMISFLSKHIPEQYKKKHQKEYAEMLSIIQSPTT